MDFGHATSLLMLPILFFYLVLLGIAVYVLVLMIGFLKKGTQAFDLYIRNNQPNYNDYPPQQPSCPQNNPEN